MKESAVFVCQDSAPPSVGAGMKESRLFVSLSALPYSWSRAEGECSVSNIVPISWSRVEEDCSVCVSAPI
jgi:hypothetical protein